MRTFLALRKQRRLGQRRRYFASGHRNNRSQLPYGFDLAKAGRFEPLGGLRRNRMLYGNALRGTVRGGLLCKWFCMWIYDDERGELPAALLLPENIRRRFRQKLPGGFDDLSLFSSAWGSAAGDDNYNPDYDISDISFDFIDEHDLAVFVDGWLSEI